MEKFNRHKRAFIKNQAINPETGRKININGKTHQRLVKKYLNKSPKIVLKISPKVVSKVSPKVVPKVSPKVVKYEIMDNGGISFIVFIKQNIVEDGHGTVYIHKNDYDFDRDKNVMATKPILTYKPDKIWIGKSIHNRMTSFSKAYGPKYDGNSILLKVNNQYIYIGPEIYSFTSIAPIKEYVSPVGNSGVPYPFAIDTQNNIYLMIEDVIMLNRNKFTDLYDDYYDIAREDGTFTYKGVKVKRWFSGKHYGMLAYFPDAVETYDRLTENGKMSMHIIDINNKKYNLTKQNYIDWMNEFASVNKLRAFKHETIVKQQ